MSLSFIKPPQSPQISRATRKLIPVVFLLLARPMQMKAVFYRITAAENDLFQSSFANMQLFFFGDILSTARSLLHPHTPTHTLSRVQTHTHTHTQLCGNTHTRTRTITHEPPQRSPMWQLWNNFYGLFLSKVPR